MKLPPSLMKELGAGAGTRLYANKDVEAVVRRCAKVCDAKIGRDCSCQVCTYLRFTATDIRNLAPQAEAKAQGDTESV